jgi:tRNA1(Val) A37 N6-methylase TrmN6
MVKNMQGVLKKIDRVLSSIVNFQQFNERLINKNSQKLSGSFFTHNIEIIDNIIDVIDYSQILNKKILEPSCGQGIFLFRLLQKIYEIFPQQLIIDNFLQNNLYFVDIDPKMIQQTEKNINRLYKLLFETKYTGKLNGFSYDFTEKMVKKHYSLFDSSTKQHPLSELIGEIDYVVGNPPYVTLYGRRDKKKNEKQRMYYLKSYDQFPDILKNGKINYVMLFIEHSLDFLKNNGVISFIIDLSFFETAYMYIRKYLLEKTKILSIEYNITGFEVASGQLILKICKSKANQNNHVKLINAFNKKISFVKQDTWYNQNDEYRFRISSCEKTENILSKVTAKKDPTLKQLYSKKNLRTCVMLLDMEVNFVFDKPDYRKDLKVYPYYQGSKSLKEKFGILYFDKYFYYDKELQDKINDELKIELEAKGIKNKKRIGLGEAIIYDNPKVYFRQSAKEIIATYDDKKSSANNSLYVFSLRGNSKDIRHFLKFICGFFNSDLVTFYSQKRNIIRYLKGKQPQIKTSDLYTVNIPDDLSLHQFIAQIVDEFYLGVKSRTTILQEINKVVYEYYSISQDEIEFIQENIKDF